MYLILGLSCILQAICFSHCVLLIFLFVATNLIYSFHLSQSVGHNILVKEVTDYTLNAWESIP